MPISVTNVFKWYTTPPLFAIAAARTLICATTCAPSPLPHLVTFANCLQVHFPSILTDQDDVLDLVSKHGNRFLHSDRSWRRDLERGGTGKGRYVHCILSSGNILIRVPNTISIRKHASARGHHRGSETNRKNSKGFGHAMNFLYPLFLMLHLLKIPSTPVLVSLHFPIHYSKYEIVSN